MIPALQGSIQDVWLSQSCSFCPPLHPQLLVLLSSQMSQNWVGWPCSLISQLILSYSLRPYMIFAGIVTYPSWLRADGGMLCICCCCQPVTEPRWRALAVLNPESDDKSALLSEYSRDKHKKWKNLTFKEKMVEELQTIWLFHTPDK